jgi:hypothetical protein
VGERVAGGEMTQTMYAHVNQRIKKTPKEILIIVLN